ncbi:multicopper oxidase domain-containing protein [Streptomyces sp. NPDC048389]|uniref:multicopper oxidase domain-containing protein n=1 Tax=Streptomyces sp. NPDC048389 TaxID=3154622 RepID=UPI003453C610
MAMDRIDGTVTRGTPETWAVCNEDGAPHNFQVQDVQFRVLEADGGRPPPELRGAKDTVRVPVGRTVKPATRYAGPADPDTPYRYCCHPPYHEDGGTTGQFGSWRRGGRRGRPVRRTHTRGINVPV